MKYKPSVKVMRSYDYCHFEVSLATDKELASIDIDDMRKEAQRLVDKAVKQYTVAKEDALNRSQAFMLLPSLSQRAKIIVENYPKSEWTPEQKAEVKAYEDAEFRASLYYDYEDEWDYIDG